LKEEQTKHIQLTKLAKEGFDPKCPFFESLRAAELFDNHFITLLFLVFPFF